MKNNSSKEILEKIKSSDNFLLSLHLGPDGDSIGSCVAMKYFLESMGKKVSLVRFDDAGEEFKFFDYYTDIKLFRSEELDLSDYDVFIGIDFGSFNLDLDIEKIFFINMDHHKTNNFYGDMNYVFCDLPSACSVLFKFFNEINFDFGEKIATPLLMGLYTDSGGFTYGGKVSLKEGLELINLGANYDYVVNGINFNIPLNRKKYFSLLIQNFKNVLIGNLNVGFSSVSNEDIFDLGLSLTDIRGGSGFLQEIGGIDILFTLVENEGFIKGSLRSRRGFDVSRVAKELGGGGHMFASAFILRDLGLEESEKVVLDTIRKLDLKKV